MREQFRAVLWTLGAVAVVAIFAAAMLSKTHHTGTYRIHLYGPDGVVAHTIQVKGGIRHRGVCTEFGNSGERICPGFYIQRVPDQQYQIKTGGDDATE